MKISEKTKTEKYIFVENDTNSIISDCSDGYIKGINQDEGKRIKLPHNNYTLLGIVDECINAPYAEDFRKDIGYTKEELEVCKPTTFILKDNSYGSS